LLVLLDSGWFGQLLGCLAPQTFIPSAMLFTSNLWIIHCSIEAGVTQMLLKQAQCIYRITQFHSVYAKRIPKTMRANTSYPTGFWAPKFGSPALLAQSLGLSSVRLHDLRHTRATLMLR
jgi:hypothetical protein